MKSVTILTTAILTVAIGAGAASAKGFGFKGPRGPEINFAEADANGDGQLTREELSAHARKAFDAADGDGSGALSATEIQAFVATQMQQKIADRSARMIEYKDDNGDGALSFDEMKPAERKMQRMFKRLDKNNDGGISTDEFAKMKDRGHWGGKRYKWGSED